MLFQIKESPCLLLPTNFCWRFTPRITPNIYDTSNSRWRLLSSAGFGNCSASPLAWSTFIFLMTRKILLGFCCQSNHLAPATFAKFLMFSVSNSWARHYHFAHLSNSSRANFSHFFKDFMELINFCKEWWDFSFNKFSIIS